MIIYRPKTMEQCLQAFGLKEVDSSVEVVMTVELMADICLRIIRIEDDHKNWQDNDTEF